eukprot:gb/GECG01009723.1/.p1 GENE.gb/GECG01009723.1/~~gb/GECG01009723.1/.p1  ORF type:complete len:347 (+),score=45.96 gb/GECG01009723.1/:1-1041(+)
MRLEDYHALVQLSAQCIAESRMWTREEVLSRVRSHTSVNNEEMLLNAMDSLFRQLYQRYILKVHHIHRKERHVQNYWKKFHNGQSLWDLAQEVQFSPYLLSRVMLERQYLASGKDQTAETKPLPRKLVSKVVNNTEMIEDERLRREVEYCRDNDPLYSPLVDEKRREIGEIYEKKLYDKLTVLGIPFETEEELRQQGLAKTPDALLTVPIGVVDHQGDTWVVNWIDSKGMFGDPVTHRKNNEQYLGYVNRFGPGMVIYWFDYVDEELKDEADSKPKRSGMVVDKEKYPLSPATVASILSDTVTDHTGATMNRDILIMGDFPVQFISPASRTACHQDRAAQEHAGSY